MPRSDQDEEAPPLLDGGESPRAAAGHRPGSLSLSKGAGLLSSVLESVRGGVGGLGLSSSPQASDSPLLPGGEEQEQSYIEHVLAPKQWPQLRGSSVSSRRITHPAASHQDQPSTPSATPVPGTPLASVLGLSSAFQAEDAGSAGYSALPAGPTTTAKAAQQQQQSGRHVRAAVAGVVNSVIALPLQLSFAAIIFRVSWSALEYVVPFFLLLLLC